jgi:hypothetical protein
VPAGAGGVVAVGDGAGDVAVGGVVAVGEGCAAVVEVAMGCGADVEVAVGVGGAVVAVGPSEPPQVVAAVRKTAAAIQTNTYRVRIESPLFRVPQSADFP